MLHKLKLLSSPLGMRWTLHNVYVKIYVHIRKVIKIVMNRRRVTSLCLTHITFPSVDNAGDTALSTAVRDIFQKNLGPISWRIHEATEKVSDGLLAKFNETNAIVIGGHGMFLPDTNANDVSNWEFACSEEQYEEIQKPIIVYAVGYNFFHGQVRTPLFESNVRKLVERSAFFGLRNTGSVREICSFIDDEILKKKVCFQPCPTMIARYLYPQLPIKVQTNRIAFNVALDRPMMRMGDNKELILDQIAKSMYFLSKRGYNINFITHMCTEIPFLTYINNYPFDYNFIDASAWDINKLMLYYNQMDVVIGMRGHGIWIPFGVNCQIISLGNQNKTKWFLEDINAVDWFIDITKEPTHLAEFIVAKFIEIHEKKGKETNLRLIDAQKRLWEITCRNMEEIKKVVELQ